MRYYLQPIQRKLLGLTLLLLLLPIFLITCSAVEPSYDGIPFSNWYRRLFGEHERTQERAFNAMVEMGVEATPFLMKKWEATENKEERYVIAQVFAQMGPNALKAKPLLVEGIDGIDENMIAYCAQALGSFGEQSADVTPMLARLLLTADFTTQIKILEALGNIGPGASEAIPRMMEAAQRSRTRTVAVEAMGKMGSKTVEHMMGWLQDGTSEQKLLACQVLGEATGNVEEALPYLTEAFKDKDPKMRVAAVRAIGRTGPAAIVVLDELIQALNDKDKDMRRETIGTLTSIGADAAGDKMLDAMKSNNGNIREGAIQVVMRWESVRDRAKPILITRLADSDAGARYAAVLALSNMGEEIVPDMIRLLSSSSVQQRGAACTVLGNIGRPARKALPRLQELRTDSDSYVAKEAQKAIDKIS